MNFWLTFQDTEGKAISKVVLGSSGNRVRSCFCGFKDGILASSSDLMFLGYSCPGLRSVSKDGSYAFDGRSKCFGEVRRMRWPDGVRYLSCGFSRVPKRGFDETQKAQTALSLQRMRTRVRWNHGNDFCRLISTMFEKRI